MASCVSPLRKTRSFYCVNGLVFLFVFVLYAYWCVYVNRDNGVDRRGIVIAKINNSTRVDNHSAAAPMEHAHTTKDLEIDSEQSFTEGEADFSTNLSSMVTHNETATVTSSLTTTTTTTTIVAAAAVERTKTTTPGAPRPQFVFHIHYHKTGHDISIQYDDAVRKAGVKMARTQSSRSRLRESSITNQIVDVQAFQRDFPDQPNYHVRRTHDPATGCPVFANFPTVAKGNRHFVSATRTKPSKVHLVFLATPNFLCHLRSHDVFWQNPSHHTSDESSSLPLDVPSSSFLYDSGPRHDVKFIHMIRDPFDMAISNFLYHSQDPTPEPWVIESNGEFYNPCRIDREFLRFVVGTDSGNTNLLTEHQVDALEALCHELMHNSQTNTPYRHYYEGLRALPTREGLRLATIQLLVTEGNVGGDLLRMTNNVLRLNEWQEQFEPSGQNTVLSLKVYPDWSRNHTGESLDRLTAFLLDDLEVWEDTDDDDDVSDATASSSTLDGHDEGASSLQRAKDDFAREVNTLTMARFRAGAREHPEHFTTSLLKTPEKRSELVADLRSDELFGPILSKFESIIDSAYGMKQYD